MGYLNFDKTKLINLEYALKREIIRTNRAGAYGSSTIVNCNTRKYHGLLICPIESFNGERHVLLSALDETVIQHNQSFNLGLHKYAGDNYEPKGHKYLRDFNSDPTPTLLYRVGGVILSKEIVFVKNDNRILIKYTLVEANSPTTLQFKPFLAFRNIHALSKSNMDVNHKFDEIDNGISSCLYQGYPDLHIQFSKKPEFIPAPDWYYDIEYKEEHLRGYDYKEDLYVPGYFELPIKKGESIVFSAGLTPTSPKGLKQKFSRETNDRTPRNSYDNCLSNAASQFFVNQNKDTFIYAGYPWLPIRNRDMLISLPGLTLPKGDTKAFHKVMASILSKKTNHLLPDLLNKNHEQNFCADSSLWLIWCLQQLSIAQPQENIWDTYKKVIKEIIVGYLNEDELFSVQKNGLIYINATSKSTSWMNSMIDGEAVIKRHGYLIEVNALWYNALKFVDQISTEKAIKNKIKLTIESIEQSYHNTFWVADKEQYADFVTTNETNLQIRPNQIFAFSLPYSPLKKVQGRKIVDSIKSQLLTPMGLRSLSPVDLNYKAKYKGDHNTREQAAFNGSVWPWLFTHYFEASFKIQSKSAIRYGKRFLKSIEPEIQINGLCSISELYHGDPAHKGKGAISFAMNTAEIQRLNWLISKNE